MTTEHRRRSDKKAGIRVPSVLTDHALELAIGVVVLLIGYGLLFLGDGRYWLRWEEAKQEYTQSLEEIDDEMKDERRQIRIWTNYNSETPESVMVGARNKNIADAEDIIIDLQAERDRKVKEWESENGN